MHQLTETEKGKRWQALAATGRLPASSKKRKTWLRQIKATSTRQRKRAKQIAREHDAQRLKQAHGAVVGAAFLEGVVARVPRQLDHVTRQINGTVDGADLGLLLTYIGDCP